MDKLTYMVVNDYGEAVGNGKKYTRIEAKRILKIAKRKRPDEGWEIVDTED